MNIVWQRGWAIFLLILACSVIVHSQKANGTSLENVVISDPGALGLELKSLLVKYARPGMSDEQISQALKGKLFAGSATTESLFALSPKLSRYVSGRDAGREGVVLRGHTYRLIPEKEFPEPDPGKFGLGGGTGSGIPRVNSRRELVREYVSDQPTNIWMGSTVRLKTVVVSPPYGGNEASLADTSQNTIQSPQTHYDLSFMRSQPISLVNVQDMVFSLDRYDYSTANGPGIVVWLPDATQAAPSKNLDVVFVVKLAPPYFKSEEFSMNDTFSSKPHIAVKNRIYADIVGIWLRDPETGEIVSKNTLDAEKEKGSSLANIAPRLPTDRRLRIITKPSASYTSIAREKGVSGIVAVRVTFLASGQIGPIVVIKSLPDGLTEQAVNAAKRITFEPETRNGRAVTVTRRIEYSFAVY